MTSGQGEKDGGSTSADSEPGRIGKQRNMQTQSVVQADAEGSVAQCAAVHTPYKADGERSEGEAMPKKAYGCVFCISGREQEVADRIQRVCPEVRATAVFQEKHKSVCGKKSKIKAVVMPGYVFFEAPDDSGIVSRFPGMDIIRILKGNDHDWQLTGNDDEFARWLFSYQGCLKFSTAYREGDRIRILSGPLKDMEGMISRVDRRGRSGQVTVKFCGRDVKLWLGFDLVDTLPAVNGGCHSGEASE